MEAIGCYDSEPKETVESKKEKKNSYENQNKKIQWNCKIYIYKL